jgi:hypothetical protein
VSHGAAGLGALVSGRADPFGRFGFDQLLHSHPHGLADQIDTFAGTKRL